LLARLKGLRGTALDPFGRAEVRRLERQLPVEYRGLVEKSLVGLSPETYTRAVKLAELPDLIRGYEDIKLRNVQRFRHEVRALGSRPQALNLPQSSDRARSRLSAPRRFLASSRCSRAPADGRDVFRGRGSRSAWATSARTRSRASSRFRA